MLKFIKLSHKDKIMKKHILMLLGLTILFTGCGIKHHISGDYYLQKKDYKTGYIYFKKEVEKKSKDDITHYYFARFLLANNKPKEALIHLNKAIELNDKNSIYYTWLGVTYGVLKKLSQEQEAYKKALILDKKNLHALTYLGHNYFDKKDYKLALETYEKVLEIDEYNEWALFNRAFCIQKLNNPYSQRIKAWKKFIDYYPYGELTIKAVEHLNNMKNFDYRNHIIGVRKITLEKIKFKNASNKLTYEAKESLNVIGRILEKYKSISIHIVVYHKKDKIKAKQKAKIIKEYILNRYDNIQENRLKLSWFDVSKDVIIKGKVHKLNETVDFISIIKK